MSSNINRIKHTCRLCLMITERKKRYELFVKSEIDSHDPTDKHGDVMDSSVASNEVAQQDIFSQMLLYEKVEFCCGIKLAPKSELPSKICGKCFYMIHMWFNFRQMSLNSQIILASKTNIKLDDNAMARNDTEMQTMRQQLLNEKRQEEESELIIPDNIKENYCKNMEKVESYKKSPPTVSNLPQILNDEEESINNDQEDEEEEADICESTKEEQDCITEICIEKLLPENPLCEEATAAIESNNSLENVPIERDRAIVSGGSDDSSNKNKNNSESSDDNSDDYKTQRRINMSKSISTSDSNESTTSNGKIMKRDRNTKQILLTINTKRKLLEKQKALKREIRKQQYIKKKLQAKLKVAELIKSAEKKEFDCSFCNEKFVGYDIFKKHVIACGNDFEAPVFPRSRTTEETIGKMFKCKYCPLYYKDQNSRRRHHKIHTDTPKHKCPVCKKRFMFRDNVNRHMLSHTEQRDYSCGVCNVAFILPHHLKNHINTLSHQEKQKSYEALGFKIVFETRETS